MRRFAGLMILLALVLSSFATAAVAVAVEWESYRDEFTEVKYNGTNGTLDWSAHSWVELGDDGKKTTGAVHVDSEGNCVGSNCLHIYAEGDDLEGAGAKRFVDTSVFAWFELCYEVRFEPNEDDSEAILKIEKQVNGGGSWYEIGRHYLYDESFQAHPIIEIGGPYQSMTLRFAVSGELDGEVFIDDVEIKGEPVESTTTTTSSTTTTSTTSSTSTTTMPTTTTTKAHVETTSTTTSPTVPVDSTTTLASTDTTESEIIVASGDPPGGPSGPPEGSGIRDTAAGLQVAFDSGLFGAVGAVGTYFVSADHDAAFRIVAEAIGASWIWMVLLGVVIAWAAVSGLDRNLERSIRRKMATPDTASD